MRIAKKDIPVKFDVPGATARQVKDFGDAEGYGKIGGEYFSLASGTDLAPLLKGLENDLCQSPHWGYVIEGKLMVEYTDGHRETASESDLFYWPPGHAIKAESDTELILFSPQHEHGEVMDHVIDQLKAL